jgi:FkbM family methyltransferase
LTGNEKILEIGGNIGRNSLIISYILNNNGNNNLVTLESSYDISQKLIHNRNINNMNFFIENAALSKRKLIQKDWTTIESDVILDGYEVVNTITYEELNKKYNIKFDTLVLDCEGAFYYILMDMPEIINNITLIIIENDFKDISQKHYVDEVLKNNNFYVDYTEMCIDPILSDFQQKNFFEVWKRNI